MGIFVDNANRLSAQDEDNMVVNRLQTKKAWLEEDHQLFLQADSDGCGTLDFEHFKAFIVDVRVQILLGKLGVEVDSISAHGLFNLLDLDGNGEIDEQEFALALNRVHGEARSLDIARLNLELNKINERIKSFTRLSADRPTCIERRTSPMHHESLISRDSTSS